MPECPFCGNRAEAFLPFGLTEPVLREQHVVGGGYRPNAVCSVDSCSSIDRERLVYLFLRDRTDLLTSGARVLHVAPEWNLSEALRHRPCYVAADLVAWERVDVVMDITDAPFPDASFDVVICNHVLEHVHDDRTALSEIHRVLATTGIAILQVPISISATTFEDAAVTDPDERARTFGQSDHVRIYGQDYPARLEAAGFSVEIVNAMDAFGVESCERYALLKDENIYVCRKEKSGAR